MKRLALVLVAICALPLGADELEDALYRSVDALSLAYRKAHPDLGMRAGLAMLDFE